MTGFVESTSDQARRRLIVEYWPIAKLQPYARNARTHSASQVDQIATSIAQLGFVNPILVGEGCDIIAGHGRLAAARKLMLPEVPVIVLAGLTDAQKRQLLLADNRIAANAGWDEELLRVELQDLAALGANLSVLGFSKGELAKALNGGVGTGATDEDAVPAASEHPVSRPGDIWILGKHRVCCGDCTDAATVNALLNGSHPGLMVTDPPYGVNYDPTWRHKAGINSSARNGKVLNDGQADWSAAWALFPGDIAYVWHGALHASTVAASLENNGLKIRAQIVWAKERLVIGRGDYHWQHEPAWYAVRNTGHWTGDRKQTTLWTIPSRNEDAETTHGTQKPVECMRRPMLNHTNPGDLVYDPFLGSGTSIIAAETIGRTCFGLELYPLYVDVIVRRWQAFTGGSAVSATSGQSFDQIAKESAGDLAIDKDHV